MKPFLISLLIMFTAPLIAAPQPAACWMHPEFLEPLSADVAEPFYAQLPKKKLSELYGGSAYTFSSVVIADAMNDGHKKYVVTVLTDHPNFPGPLDETIYFVEKKNGTLKWLGEVPRPVDKHDKDCWECTWYQFSYEGQQVTKLCGQTYLVFDVKKQRVVGGEVDYQSHRDAYIVENNETKDACDDNWARYEYNGFSTAQANDKDAQSAFQFYLDKCKNKMNPKLYTEFSAALAKRVPSIKSTNQDQPK